MIYNFLSLAVSGLLFGTLKSPTGFLAFQVPRSEPKKLKINLGNPPKILRKVPYQLAIFWPNFSTRNARNSIRVSKNVYYALESKNIARQNVGTWDRMLTSYN